MIKHIIFFKLKDNSDTECEKARDMLISMKEKVNVIKDMHVGIDFLHSDRSYDIVLEVLLEDRHALDAYQNDPYHHGVVKAYMQKVMNGSVAVDFEVE